MSLFILFILLVTKFILLDFIFLYVGNTLKNQNSLKCADKE